MNGWIEKGRWMHNFIVPNDISFLLLKSACETLLTYSTTHCSSETFLPHFEKYLFGMVKFF